MVVTKATHTPGGTMTKNYFAQIETSSMPFSEIEMRGFPYTPEESTSTVITGTREDVSLWFKNRLTYGTPNGLRRNATIAHITFWECTGSMPWAPGHCPENGELLMTGWQTIADAWDEAVAIAPSI